MEDIYITPMEGQVPRWLEDADVREGICAILKVDQCIEEHCHLVLKVDNLCRWFGQELSAVEIALAKPSSKVFTNRSPASNLVELPQISHCTSS